MRNLNAIRWDDITEYLRKNDKTVKVVLHHASICAAILFVAYMIASIVSSVTVMFLADAAVRRPTAQEVANVKRPKIGSDTNYTALRKTVVDRNVFNSSGELPDEALEGDGGKSGQFNPNDVCHKSSMPLALMGTIYLGSSGDSLATIKDSGYNEADIYRKGDRIIGYEQALIYDIQHQKVILNNNGVKECLDVQPVKGINLGTTPVAGGSSPGGGGGGSTSYTLEASYVEDALGPGFSKILEVGRLVPEIKDGQQKGFKLVGVKNESLWRRVGLNSGDVITAVNGISMAQPDQGFAVYNALQDQREIRIEFLKNGTDPSTSTVEIK